MKKFYVFAAVAIAVLASCTKSEVVYNQGQQEIGFKAVTGAITKAEQTSTLDGTMGVLAFIHGETTGYFGNTSFAKDGDVWVGGKYWPVTKSLDFAVYAPWVDGTTFESNKLTIATDNSLNTAIASQTDYLYGAKYYTNNGSGYDKNTVSVPVTLKHAQAKVTVSFTGENATVTDVKLDAPILKGTCAVTYSNPINVKWTPGEPNSAVTLIATADLSTTPATASLLVVPEAKTSITFTYQIDGSETTLTHTITPDANWEHGTHYIYSIDIKPKEIKFTPTVDTTWGTGTTTPVTL